MMMPSPTAASAAASVMIKIAKTCPPTHAEQPRERHEINIHGVQNQLDAHQNDDDVAARDHADDADGEERQTEHEIMCDR